MIKQEIKDTSEIIDKEKVKSVIEIIDFTLEKNISVRRLIMLKRTGRKILKDIRKSRKFFWVGTAIQNRFRCFFYLHERRSYV